MPFLTKKSTKENRNFPMKDFGVSDIIRFLC